MHLNIMIQYEYIDEVRIPIFCYDVMIRTTCIHSTQGAQGGTFAPISKA